MPGTLHALLTTTNGVLPTYHGAVWTCPKSHPCVGSLLPTLTIGVPWFWDRGVHPGSSLGRPSGLNTCWREREANKQNGTEEGSLGAPAKSSVNPLRSAEGGMRQLIHEVKWSEVKVAQLCLTLCNPMDWGNSSGQNTGEGSLSLFHGIFPTQGSNPGLPHCRWILYQLSHKEVWGPTALS